MKFFKGIRARYKNLLYQRIIMTLLNDVLVVDPDSENWGKMYRKVFPPGIKITETDNYKEAMELSENDDYFITIVEDVISKDPDTGGYKDVGMGTKFIRDLKLKKPSAFIVMISGKLPPISEHLPGVDYISKIDCMEQDGLKEYLLQKYKESIDYMFEESDE